MAASCCRCMSTGRCLRCSCVREGRLCDGCYPSKKGLCRNIPSDQLSSSAGQGSEMRCLNHVAVLDQSSNLLSSKSIGSQRSGGFISEPLGQESDKPAVVGDLPPFKPVAPLSSVMWGDLDPSSFGSICSSIYDEVVHWRLDLMKIPSGNCGRAVVSELSRLYQAFGEGSSLESIALTVAGFLPSLLLQRPCSNSKESTNRLTLSRRLKQWKEGDFRALVEEGRAIQAHRKYKFNRMKQLNDELSMSKSFSNMIFQGRVDAALRRITDQEKGGLLHLNDEVYGKSVKSILKDKHPEGQLASQDVLLPSVDSSQSFSVIFDSLDASVIRRAALNTKGSAGPSGLVAYAWRRLCSSFGKKSDDLCHSLSLMAKRLCTDFIDPDLLMPFLACHLIAIDKNPGVRPIGIGETVRRIIAKAVHTVLKPDILESVGCHQLCIGQMGGVESGVQSIRELFKVNEAVLLVDASNAFNSLNRRVMCRFFVHPLLPFQLIVTESPLICT